MMLGNGLRLPGIVLLTGIAVLGGGPAEAGGPFGRRSRVIVPSMPLPTSFANGMAPTPMLGSFYPGPVMFVRADWPAGDGYSPLGMGGNSVLPIYGPTSSLRSTAAPVDTYSRGYDGRLYPSRSTGFSYPNLPTTAPVVYPTQATYYYGFPESGTPPSWKNGSLWIDQN